MGGCSGPEIPPKASEDPNPIPAAHVDIYTSTGTLKPSKEPADACADEGEINVAPPIPSLVHFALGSFAFAMFLISLITFVVFFAVTWLTVIRDARLMKDQVLSNATGVSLSFYFCGCASLTFVVTIGIDTRPPPSTRS